MIRRWDRWCPEGCKAPEHTSEGGLDGMAPARKALRRKRGLSRSPPINCSSDVGGHEARTGSRGNCKCHWGLSGIAVATARNKGSSRRHHSRWWRLTQPCSSEPRNNICTILMLTTLAVTSSSNAADLPTEYLKPTVSSKECMEVVGLISAKTTSLGNDGACMQCDPANDVCPPGCQALVDDLYNTCDGVTTPDGLYFDPDNSIEGEWSDKVKARIKIATERCGCDDSTRKVPLGTLLGSSFASSVGLVVLVSFASWFMAACLFVLPNNRR